MLEQLTPETSLAEFLELKKKYHQEQQRSGRNAQRGRLKRRSKSERSSTTPSIKRPFFNTKVASTPIQCDSCHKAIHPGQTYLRDVNRVDHNVYCDSVCSRNHLEHINARKFSTQCQVKMPDLTLGTKLRLIVLNWTSVETDGVAVISMTSSDREQLLSLIKQVK